MDTFKGFLSRTKTEKEKQKEASNCYQWVSDLYSLFIEHEDEQRARTLKKGTTMVLHSDTDDAKALRAFVKQFGFTCHGLDYQHVSDVCEGRASTLHFVLSCDPKKVKVYLDAKPSLLKTIKDLSVKATKLLFTGAVYYNEGFGLGTIPLLGLAALSSYVYTTTKGYSNKELLRQLNDQLKIFRDDFAGALGLGEGILQMQSLPSEANDLELHVTIKAEELKEGAKGAKGKKVGSLFPPTQRGSAQRGVSSGPPSQLLF
tara:strand:+ start:627 stop:1403 length:777 start_codon:yes stop_codon:yes gene_type:complete